MDWNYRARHALIISTRICPLFIAATPSRDADLRAARRIAAANKFSCSDRGWMTAPVRTGGIGKVPPLAAAAVERLAMGGCG